MEENGTKASEVVLDSADVAEEAVEAVEQPREIAAAETAQEIEEWKNRFIRLQADFDNYRKRVNRERLEERDRGIEEVVLPLLQIADNLSRAVKAAQDSSDYAALLKGVEMINAQLSQVLAQFEVTPIEAVNQPFNPNLHHAVMHAETSEILSNTVIAELQTGYQRKDKVLRPSMVQVAINTDSLQGGNEGK